MSVEDVRNAIRVARNFVLWDIYGPGGELGTFEPVSVKFDEDNGIWIVVCSFKKEGTLKKAKMKIDSKSGKVLNYELLEE